MRRFDKIVVVVMLIVVLGVSAYAAGTGIRLYKASQISPSVVGISCPVNGADPTLLSKVDGVLLISCGK